MGAGSRWVFWPHGVKYSGDLSMLALRGLLDPGDGGWLRNWQETAAGWLQSEAGPCAAALATCLAARALLLGRLPWR